MASIERSIQLAHTARAQRREDFVWSEFRACSERHFFFSSEIQFATTVIGGDSPVLTSWLSRNFCPPEKTK